MIMLYANTAFDDLVDYGEEERQKKIAAFVYNMEKLLGMKQGELWEAMLPVFAPEDK